MTRTICGVTECDRFVVSGGWCLLHLRRWRRHGDPLKVTRAAPYGPDDICRIDGCSEQAAGRGMCRRHFDRARKRGNPEALRSKELVTIDLVGQRFGSLTVVRLSHRKNGAFWVCACDCGKGAVRKGSSLRDVAKNGAAVFVSCGCRHNWKTHGLKSTNSRILKIFYGMKKRCFNKTNDSYKNYGGRGITIFKAWVDDPAEFVKWAVNNGYAESLTIERRDVNGNYEPENCCWIPKGQQCLNTRISRHIEFDGRIQTLSEWARERCLQRATLIRRFRRGWSVEDALTIPAFLGRNSRS